MQLIDDIRHDNPEANIIYINMEHEEFQMLHDDADLFNLADLLKLTELKRMHPKVWTVAMYQSNNIHIDNIHTIAHGMSSDGCDITGCHDVLVENSFFRGHDDILTVKARDFIHEMTTPQSCENVTFKNNVIWSDSSNPMTIGYETDQDIKNILHEGIDVLNMSRPDVWQLEAVMAIEPHDEGNIDGVTYKDIRVDVQIPQNSLFRFSIDGGTGNIKNITLDNIWVNYGGTLGGLIYGTTTADIDGIRFNNVRNDEGLVLSADKVTTSIYSSISAKRKRSFGERGMGLFDRVQRFRQCTRPV